MTIRDRNSFKNQLCTLLTVIPPVILLFLVAAWAVPIPYLDQWHFVPCLQKMYEGGVSFHDLRAQHHEHRLVFPRLIMLMLARLSDWDIRCELATNIVLAAGIMLTWILIIRRTGRHLGMDLNWGIPVSSVAIFSLTQYQNWFWGWQLQMFLNLLAVLLGIALLSSETFKWSRLFGAAALGIVATYSFANGIAFWPIGFVLIALTVDAQRRGTALTTWTAIAGISIWSYLYDYQSPPEHPSLRHAFTVPIEDFLFYITNYIGGTFAQWDVDMNQINGFARFSAFAFGMGGPVIVGWISWKLARQSRRNLMAILPFLAICVYSLFAALLSAVGRVAMGPQQAFQSRYCTMVVPVWISLVVLLLIWGKDATRQITGPSRCGPKIAFSIIAVITFFLILNSFVATHSAHEMTQMMEKNKSAAIAFANQLANPPTDSDLDVAARINPEPELVLESIPVLIKYNLTVFAPHTQN